MRIAKPVNKKCKCVKGNLLETPSLQESLDVPQQQSHFLSNRNRHCRVYPSLTHRGDRVYD